MILCVWDRVWGVSITTLDCGLTVILAVVIAVHGPGAQHMAALSSLLMRTSLWTQWRCGPWENFQSLKRSAHSFAALAFTEISKVTFSQHNICVLVSGWRGKAKEEYPKCGSRSPGYYWDDREDSAQPGLQGARGGPGAVTANNLSQ